MKNDSDATRQRNIELDEFLISEIERCRDLETIRRFAEQAEELERRAAARACWATLAEQCLESGQKSEGCEAYVRAVAHIRDCGWSPALSGLPLRLQALDLDAVEPELAHKTLLAIAWSKLGNGDFYSANRMLERAQGLPTSKLAQAEILIQRASLLIITDQGAQAEELLKVGIERLDADTIVTHVHPLLTLGAMLNSTAIVREVSNYLGGRRSPATQLGLAGVLAASQSISAALPLYVQIQRSTEATKEQRALAYSNAAYFSGLSGDFSVITRSNQTLRIDAERARDSLAFNQIERAQGEMSGGESRSSRLRLQVALFESLNEGHWGAWGSACCLLAELCLQAKEEPLSTLVRAINGCSSDLVRRSGAFLSDQADGIAIREAIKRLLHWPNGYNHRFALIALAALADLLNDGEFEECWKLALQTPAGSPDAAARAELVTGLSSRFCDSNAVQSVRYLIEGLGSNQSSSVLEALVKASSSLGEFTDLIPRDNLTKLLDSLITIANTEAPASRLPSLATKVIVNLLSFVPELSVRQEFFSSLKGLREADREAFSLHLELDTDPQKVWQAAIHLLKQRPDPVDQGAGYRTMAITGGPTPDEALSLLRWLDESKQHRVVREVCRVIREHDCLPQRRASALLRLSQLDATTLQRCRKDLIKLTEAVLDETIHTGEWSKRSKESVSTFSAVKITYGEFTTITRGAFALLGSVAQWLSKKQRAWAQSHLGRAVGSPDSLVRHGAALFLYNCSTNLKFDWKFLPILTALVNDSDPQVCACAMRGASRQISKFPAHEAEDTLLSLVLGQASRPPAALKRALSIAVATLWQFRSDLHSRLKVIRESLNSDVNFHVRENLRAPDVIC